MGAATPKHTRIFNHKPSYRVLVEAMNEGAVILHPDGTIAYCNGRFAEMMKAPCERLIGSTFRSFLRKAEEHPFQELLRKNLKEGAKGEFNLRTEEEAYLPVLLSSRFMSTGAFQGFCFVVADLSERKRAEEDYHNLSARLLQIQDQERRKIARELHDSTAQNLAGVSLHLNLMEQSAELDATNRQRITASLRLVRQCADEIRNMSCLLHPPLLDEVGLPVALRVYIDGFVKRTGASVEVEIPPRLGHLPSDLSSAVFRLIQECLSNIHRHSGSQAAQVRVTRNPDHLAVEVSDQGRGMPNDGTEAPSRTFAQPGIGIPGMRERIKLLGGRLDITSGNHGTTVRAVLPVDSAP